MGYRRTSAGSVSGKRLQSRATSAEQVWITPTRLVDVADRRPKRMHTVAQSYLESFADDEPARRTSRVWRFDRVTGEAKLIGVRDAEVVKDIYTVWKNDGTPDTGIEDEIFCNIEGAFCAARDLLLVKDRIPNKDDWAGAARFVAAQLLRTPRVLHAMADEMMGRGIGHQRDMPQRVMLLLIERWIPRLLQMRGIAAHNDTGVPFLTSDNPAVWWKKEGNGFIIGVDQYDPNLLVSCPLSPTLMFVAYQTPESLRRVHSEQLVRDGLEAAPTSLRTSIQIGAVPESEVRRLNHICINNAHRYVYANHCNSRLLQFLKNRFFGAPPPVSTSRWPSGTMAS